MASTPTTPVVSADSLALALTLARAGYWVFPAYRRMKGATRVGGLTWGEIMDKPDLKGLPLVELQRGLTMPASQQLAKEITGAALCPSEGDPVPLVILDVDTFDADMRRVWQSLAGRDVSIPEGTGIVRSASGGWHFWFRLPDGLAADQLPDCYDFGQEVKGECRVSRKRRALIMLPGSVVNTAKGGAKRLGTYSEVQAIQLDKLPELPEALAVKLMVKPAARPAGGEGDGGKPPTEVLHLRDLLSSIPAPIEDRNIFVARVGQVLGRMFPADGLPQTFRDLFWTALSPRLGDFTAAEFDKALNSGYRSGVANARRYDKRAANPTVSDIRAECETLFGHVPWVKRVRILDANEDRLIVAIGGSGKRPHEAIAEVEIDNIGEALSGVTRLAEATMDDVVRSPLFTAPGWRRAFEFMLKTECIIEDVGILPEDRFWIALNSLATTGAREERFVESWSEPYRGLGSSFLLFPLTGELDPLLVLLPQAREHVALRSGDVALVKRLLQKHTTTKKLMGMKGEAAATLVPLAALDAGVQSMVVESYTRYVQHRRGDQGAE